MTIRETEHLQGQTYYGRGLVICSGTDFVGHSLKKRCHKDGTYIYDEFHGYERDKLTDIEIAKVYAQAFLHDQKVPDHQIRVIIFEREQ